MNTIINWCKRRNSASAFFNTSKVNGGQTSANFQLVGVLYISIPVAFVN